jgi:hypothetical protein
LKAAEEKNDYKRPPAPDIHFTVEPPKPEKPIVVDWPAAGSFDRIKTEPPKPNGVPEPSPIRESAADTAGNPFIILEQEPVL